MSRTVSSSALPSAMEIKLRAIRRRQAALAVVRAIAVGASVLVAAMIVAMIADWMLTLFDTRVRIALTAGSLAAAAVALLVTGAPPLIAAFGWLRAAASADSDVPQLEERWTTVANFAASEHQPTSPAAKAMLEQVRSEAIAMGRLVQPQRVARPAAVRSAVLTLGGCLLLLAGFLSLNWTQTSVLLRRFWSPTADITATQLTSLTGDVTVPRGEMFDLVTELTGVPRRSARLTLRHESGLVDVFELTPDPERSRAFIHPMRADSSFRYRLRAGDGQTRWHAVRVIDYPALAEVRLKVTAPDYVNRPPIEKTVIPNRVRVVQGSRLELLMKPVAELERLDLALGRNGQDGESIEQVLTLTPDAAGWYRFETQLLADLSLRPRLLSSHGLTNQDKPVCRIQVVPDKAPVARIITPTDEMAVTVDDVIDIEFEAHDDHGVASAELVVYEESPDGEEPKILSIQPIPLGDKELERHVTAKTQLDLKSLNLMEGTQISYAVRVTDNRMVEFEPDGMTAQAAEAARNKSEAAAQPRDGDSRPAEIAERTEAATERTDDSKTAMDAPATQLADAKAAIEKRLSADATATQDPQNEERAARPRNDRSTTAAPAAADDEPSENETRPRTGGESPENTSSNRDAPVGDAERSPTEDSANSDAKQNPSETTATAADSPESDEPTAPKETESGQPAGAADSDESDLPNRSKPANPAGPSAQSGDDADVKPAETAVAAAASSDETARDSRGGRPPAGDEGPRPDNAQDGIRATAMRDENAGGAAPTPTDADAGREDAQNLVGQSGQASNADNEPQNDDEREPNETPRIQGDAAGALANNGKGTPSDSPPPSQPVAMNAQQPEAGQNSESRRRRLKITERLTAVAAAQERRSENMEIRDRVVEIDKMLAEVEAGLTRVVERNIPDASRSDQFRIVDKQLGNVEGYIGELRTETQDGRFAFVGLQMLDLGRSHVTPARDRVFIAIRDPGASDGYATDALQHVVRARELLAALLKRYERVVRDRELAQSLQEAVKMYEVYIEEAHRLMREARQNTNPLARKMAVVEVDQDYLDRLAEVLTLRREMLKEFARILGDDPRLMARYLDLIKRRRTSLRDQLSELAERQEVISTELSSWLAVREAQRENLWMLIAEMRLQTATDLARDAAELAERVEKQTPLVLDASHGTAARVIQHAQEIAGIARSITFETRRLIQNGGTADERTPLTKSAMQLVHEFGELDAALDQLNFENESNEEVASYVRGRLLESRTVADQADEWAQAARHIQQPHYPGLAEIDQRKVGIATELLRVEMLGIESDLEGQFQQQTDDGVPGEIVDLVRQLHRAMEAVTFHQSAAMFALSTARLEEAERQQARALERFDEAEKLFDAMRRAVISVLDEYDLPNPNIADLQDPTLDEFLARLEREPNIEAQLGIPNRPRNLRIIADVMTWQQEAGAMLGASSAAAVRRAREAMDAQRRLTAMSQKREEEMTDEERAQRAEAKEMQDLLEKSLASIREKIDDPNTTPEERRQLEQTAENLQRMLDQAGGRTADAEEWERIAEADQAKAVLQALAQGKPIPDEQWNKLLSTLEDGLWQVRGKTPPEEYRRAIEQYQDRLRQLTGTTGAGAD